ncbi:integrase [Citrobacter freundii]|nr:integrase [Citrobacter freundii]MDV1152726.1 integrase [Citrobacter freundii]MEB0499126.1 integrase [Citrobacter freundii]
MYHVDNSTGVPVMPQPSPVTSETELFFTEGGNGVPPTFPGPDWFNIIQSELINILRAAGLDPDKMDNTQILAALKKLFLSRSNPFGDIKADGAAAIATALSNLHLEELPNFAKYGAPMIGELIEWPSDKMPNEIYPDMKMEFIPYIGQSFDPVKYPLLATLHPNLHLPVDMRANVVRGWDWGRGVDAGRVLMSEQNDAMQRITGELTDMGSGDSLQATGAFTITPKPSQHWYAAAAVSSAYLYYRAIGFDNASVVRTANENRMKNAAWNMIVRAK